LGGKSHELVVELLGLLAGEQAKANHGVLVDADEATGLPHAAAFRDVVQQVHDLLLRQAAVEQRRSLAFGETRFARSAPQQPPPLGTVASRHRQVAVAAFAVIGTLSILAAELAQFVHVALRSGSIAKRPCFRSSSRVQTGRQTCNTSKTRPIFRWWVRTIARLAEVVEL
jgi:hypothetical protein